jgi:hypothetical protein
MRRMSEIYFFTADADYRCPARRYFFIRHDFAHDVGDTGLFRLRTLHIGDTSAHRPFLFLIRVRRPGAILAPDAFRPQPLRIGVARRTRPAGRVRHNGEYSGRLYAFRV